MTIQNLTLVNGIGDAGGALRVGSDAQVIPNAVTLKGNFATDQGGGAVFVDQGGDLTIVDSIFQDNQTTGSGGALLVAGFVSIDQTNLIQNKSGISGGGAFTVQQRATAIVTGGQVAMNQTAGPGGGIHVLGGGTLGLVETWVFKNEASIGGGLASEGGSIGLDRLRVTNNVAVGDGGGLIIDGGSTLIRQSEVSGNLANNSSGAVAILDGVVELINTTLSGNEAITNGGGLFLSGGSVTQHHSTVAENRSREV